MPGAAYGGLEGAAARLGTGSRSDPAAPPGPDRAVPDDAGRGAALGGARRIADLDRPLPRD